MGIVVTDESFIIKANIIHNNKYDYSKVYYLKATIKIIIVCPIHGEFKQTPNSHLNGSGCPKCGRNIVENSRRSSTEIFIKKSKIVHNDYYIYDNTNYVGYDDYVIITCPIHGNFKQKAKKHLQGNKCKKCVSMNLMINQDVVIERANIIYNNYYSYDKFIYNGIYNSTIVTCPLHGDFEIKPISHIHKQRGCKKCLNRTSSIDEHKWLDLLEIKNRNVYLQVGNKTLCVDGYDEKTKTIYEFYGDFFHGNPEVHDQNELNPLVKETYGELYKKTKEKEDLIIKNGFNLITIWEKEFKKIK